jgi:hypothetical protein
MGCGRESANYAEGRLGIQNTQFVFDGFRSTTYEKNELRGAGFESCRDIRAIGHDEGAQRLLVHQSG